MALESGDKELQFVKIEEVDDGENTLSINRDAVRSAAIDVGITFESLQILNDLLKSAVEKFNILAEESSLLDVGFWSNPDEKETLPGAEKTTKDDFDDAVRKLAVRLDNQIKDSIENSGLEGIKIRNELSNILDINSFKSVLPKKQFSGDGILGAPTRMDEIKASNLALSNDFIDFVSNTPSKG